MSAFVAPETFDPENGYPTKAPAGSTQVTRGYVGIIPVLDDQGNPSLAYCIDLFTDTGTGVTYQRGDWAESNVRNLGRVGYILQNYYPTVPDQPADQPDNVRSAAVQAAIWFFSDNFVVHPAEGELYDLTAAIVADTLAHDPVGEPAQPTLSISPSSGVAPSTGDIVGPFTVTADGPSTLQLKRVEVFADEAGTQPLAQGATVQPGARLWARSTEAGDDQGFSLRRAETVLANTVYLYDGATPGRDAAQSLVLAETTELEAVAGVRITQFAAGGIEVTKTISGDGAGFQGPIDIRVVCTPADGGDPIERTSTIPAGATGSQTVRFTGLPAGSECTITEPKDGDNGRVNLTASSIEPASVSIVAGENVSVAATNEYARAFGELKVTKVIEGPAAGEQDEIVLAVDCDDDAFDRELRIPAGSPAGTYPLLTVTDIPAGTKCRVTETASGATDTVQLDETTVSPESVTIADSETSEVTVTNSYSQSEENGDGGGTGGSDGGSGDQSDGGSGDQSDGGSGDGGPVSSGFLPRAGAPGGPLTLGIALLVAGAAVLFIRRRMAGRA
ncbi:hypothetical protein GEV27_09685 [Aeromicrobium sp. S22]|uniref:thioester domain-containing protein n=1 Tax=Aeromicrobium sp. S22 TaxID=2662029 RepID=UPI00129E1782|nr:thioester domain-containing protein [Aeromicrobium sp. S22]MRK01792.1 hypothetical protein [Aeromicrobium sp. S22]